jgi:hypothetical protein
VVGAGNALDKRFAAHLNFASKQWFAWRWNFVNLVFKYGEKLADEQLITEYEVYQPLADIVAMLVAIQGAKAAAAAGDTGRVAALNMLCEALTCRLSGKAPTSRGLRAATEETMQHVMDGNMRELDKVPVKPIFQSYELKD